MQYVSVILDIPTQALDRAYTYSVPESLSVDIQVGCAVLVPFGAQSLVGFVIARVSENSLECSTTKIKAVKEVLSKPLFTSLGAETIQWMARHYLAPLSSCVRLFAPPKAIPRLVNRSGERVIEGPRATEVEDTWVFRGPTFESFVPRSNAVKQRALLEALKKGNMRVAELSYEFGSISQVLASLEKKQVICLEKRRRLRTPGELIRRETAEYQHTTYQTKTLKTIKSLYNAHRGEVAVLDGVTGSGKTEVYLSSIEYVLSQGQNAIVLVPEISLTAQTVARFRGRFGDMVAVLHSKMSDGERYDQWDLIRNGAARVVVGARSALFAPLNNIGIIIIDEEHESSYKQDSSPRYLAVEVAQWIVKRAHAMLILGSATPSMETLFACKKYREQFNETPSLGSFDNTQTLRNDYYHLLSLPERVNGKPLPPVEICNMAQEFHNGARSMFSYKLQSALKDSLYKGQKAVLFLNQRGFSRFLLCRDCGFVPECDHCSVSLTYHDHNHSLVCHHCGHKIAALSVCPVCGSPYLKKFGAGTERVEAELRLVIDDFGEGFDLIPIIRMDADTTAKKGAHQKLLEQFALPGPAVLLGTQMIAKGLDFKEVTVVGVINADTTLRIPDFRSQERTFTLIEQVAGRAGRGELEGCVFVQTYDPTSLAIRAAQSYDRELFLQEEFPKRKAFCYPPFRQFANVLMWGLEKDYVATYAKRLEELLREYLKHNICSKESQAITIFPAQPCLLERVQKAYRFHIVISAQREVELGEFFEEFFRRRKPDNEVKLAFDLHPQSLF